MDKGDTMTGLCLSPSSFNPERRIIITLVLHRVECRQRDDKKTAAAFFFSSLEEKNDIIAEELR